MAPKEVNMTGTSTTTHSYDIRTPIQKTLDDLKGYLEHLETISDTVLRLNKKITELEARIKALEERPPTYVPFPVYPSTPYVPLGPYYRYDNTTNTWVKTEVTTSTGGNP